MVAVFDWDEEEVEHLLDILKEADEEITWYDEAPKEFIEDIEETLETADQSVDEMS